MSTRVALILGALFLAGCPHGRDRGACSEHTHCRPGSMCGPHGRCTERCDNGTPCLKGEACLPSSEVAGEGLRWCMVGCEDQDDCDGMFEHFQGRTVCREIIYPPSGGGVSANLCSDPHHGWGDTGNDPPEQADDSGE